MELQRRFDGFGSGSGKPKSTWIVLVNAGRNPLGSAPLDLLSTFADPDRQEGFGPAND